MAKEITPLEQPPGRATAARRMLADLQAGVPAAQQWLFRTHLAGLTGICKRICADALQAEEIAVEVLGDFLLRHVHRIENPASIGSYLRICAIRKARKAQLRKIKESELPEEFSDPDEEALADEAALQAVLAPRLERCLGKLRPKARRMLRLSFFEDLNHKQIGEMLGDSGQYVGRMIAKSLDRLKRCISHESLVDKKSDRGLEAPMDGEQALHKALENRYAQPDSDLCDALVDRILTAPESLGRGHEPADFEHAQGCGECKEDLRWLRLLEREGLIPGDTAEILPIGSRILRPRWLGLAAGLLLLFGALGWWTLGETERPPGELQRKGPNDEFAIAVQRGVRQFRVRPTDRLLAGDQLGFFYSAAEPGHLLVLSLEGDGSVEVLIPAGEQHSTAIRAGAEIPLVDGGNFESSPGCAWVLAIFSDAPLRLPQIRPSIQLALQNRQGCRLGLQVDQARTSLVWIVSEPEEQ